MLNLNTNPTSDNVATGNIRIPRDIYGIRCCDAKYKLSSQKQTPYIALTWEVCTPESVVMAGQEVKIAGLRATSNFYLTEKAVGRLIEFLKLMKLPTDLELNENDEEQMGLFCKQFLGKGASAVLEAREFKQTKEVVDEKGDIVYQPMLDEDGKEIVGYAAEVKQFRGPKPELTVDAAY